eukprot:SAG31_NODE_703_length_12720_cov_10.185088_5_plen_108_part_00
MSSSLAELDAVMEAAGMAPPLAKLNDLNCTSLSQEALPWGSATVVSGARFGSRRELWRVTFRTAINHGSVLLHPHNVKIMSSAPFSFWPTGVGEWCKCCHESPACID